MNTQDYYYHYIPPRVRDELEAGAFQTVCEHLRDRSDAVSNIDLMNLSGFCRNCLAKWLVVEARHMSTKLTEERSSDNRSIAALDAFGYDEAAEYVYGITYPEWKKRHQKKATDQQIMAFETSTSLHAVHDSELIKKRGDIFHVVGGSSQADSCVSHRYFTTFFPSHIRIQLEAGAFRQLCKHLSERSQQMQNMALMTLSGFCRNCLAKWLVVQARLYANQIEKRIPNSTTEDQEQLKMILDAFGYEEAAEFVYGSTYQDWKIRFQTKPTEDQMRAYEESISLHAKHDKDLLKARADKDTLPEISSAFHQSIASKYSSISSNLLSNVCCQDVNAICPPQPKLSELLRSLYIPIRPPSSVEIRLGILTVSDRASANKYETGDLSGPAVERTVEALVSEINASFGVNVAFRVSHRAVVPDDIVQISLKLKSWAESHDCNLIFTTGGTGFSPRDVTPEATLRVLEKESRSLMTFASMECSKVQPLAANSRGTAGIYKSCIIANLPGSPEGAAQVTTVLLPLLLHAIKHTHQNK